MSAETASDRQKEGPSAIPTARLTPACQPIARFPHHPVTPLLYGKTSRIIGKTPPKPHFSRLCREIFPALRQEMFVFAARNKFLSAQKFRTVRQGINISPLFEAWKCSIRTFLAAPRFQNAPLPRFLRPGERPFPAILAGLLPQKHPQETRPCKWRKLFERFYGEKVRALNGKSISLPWQSQKGHPQKRNNSKDTWKMKSTTLWKRSPASWNRS